MGTQTGVWASLPVKFFISRHVCNDRHRAAHMAPRVTHPSCRSFLWGWRSADRSWQLLEHLGEEVTPQRQQLASWSWEEMKNPSGSKKTANTSPSSSDRNHYCDKNFIKTSIHQLWCGFLQTDQRLVSSSKNCSEDEVQITRNNWNKENRLPPRFKIKTIKQVLLDLFHTNSNCAFCLWSLQSALTFDLWDLRGRTDGWWKLRHENTSSLLFALILLISLWLEK